MTVDSLFEALLEASTDNITVVDRDGRYVHVSRGAAATVGLTPPAMIGRTWRELGLPAATMEIVEASRENVFRTSQPHRQEMSLETADGVRYFEYQMFPLRGYVAVVARDITGRREAEMAAARAAERYRAFVANSTEGIWRFELDRPIDTTLDRDEQIAQMMSRAYLAECNDVMARMYGYDRASDITGARLHQMLDPKDPRNLEYLRAFIDTGYALRDAESIETDRHGNIRYFLNSLTGVVENGQVTRAWGTQRDITVEKEKTEKLRASEQRLQALVSASSEIIWTATADGNLTSISDSWATLTGQSVAAALGRGWLAMVHPEDRNLAEMPLRPNAGSDTLEAAVRIRTRNGSYCWFQIHGAAVRNDDGSVREWIGANNDIDAQQRETKELALRRARAEFLAEANDLFVRSLDYEETLRSLARMVVPRLADWCGVDMVGSDGRLHRLAAEHLDPEMRRLAIEMQERFPPPIDSQRGAMNVVRTGKPDMIFDIPDEVVLAAAQGPEHLEMIRKLRLKSWICVPILVRSGVAGVLTLVNTETSPRFTDDDVQLAEGLAARAGHAIENARLYQQAVEANRLKDEFLATLSHELRTPLTSILGWATLLRLSPHDGEAVAKAAATIERSAKTQATLIDDLLDISRIVTGKLPLDIQTIDAVQAIENGISTARHAAEAKHITIEVDAPPSLPIRADPSRLQQIIWNLMSNAVKFSSEGARVDVIIRKEDDVVVIEVRDQGIGIDPAALPHVFERFWQADSSSHRSHSGLGLGLAIVKYLVELHGGTIIAESGGLSKGATFRVRLPSA